MIEKLDALRELLAMVQVGDFPILHKTLSAAGLAHNSYGLDQRGYAWEAYNGSLDAAKALHEAVLPGWGMVLSSETARVTSNDTRHLMETGRDTTLSRGWLIAILKALIAQEAGQ